MKKFGSLIYMGYSYWKAPWGEDWVSSMISFEFPKFLHSICLVKCFLLSSLIIYMFLGCLWIPCMSLLSSLVNSFKYILVYSNLWYFMDSHVRILEFTYKYFGLRIIWELLRHEHVIFGIVCLGVFIRDFTWTSSWVYFENNWAIWLCH